MHLYASINYVGELPALSMTHMAITREGQPTMQVPQNSFMSVRQSRLHRVDKTGHWPLERHYNIVMTHFLDAQEQKASPPLKIPSFNSIKMSIHTYNLLNLPRVKASVKPILVGVYIYIYKGQEIFDNNIEKDGMYAMLHFRVCTVELDWYRI